MAKQKLISGATTSSTPQRGEIPHADVARQASRYQPLRVRPHVQEAIDKLVASNDRLARLDGLSGLLPLAASTLIECVWFLQTFATTAQEGRLAAVVSADGEDAATRNVLIHASSLLNEACIMLGYVADFGAHREHVDDPLWGFELDRDLWYAKSALAMIATVFGFEVETEAWSQCELGILSLIDSLEGCGHEINRAIQALAATRALGIAPTLAVRTPPTVPDKPRKAANLREEVPA